MKKFKALSKEIEILTEPRYLLAEKQLASIPLWEPIKKPGKGQSPREKMVTFTTKVKGRPVKVNIKVKAGGNDGFPNTTDLDIFRAIEQLATEEIQQQGSLSNPFCFKGQQLLTAASKKNSGRSYLELKRCLAKLHDLSFEVVRTDGKRERAWRFHLFNTVYQEGDRKPEGTVAEFNEIELAAWYAKSLQVGNCLVIDHDLFQRLALSLSKLLHQFLHAQFYMHHGVAMEWYADLAKNWGMKEYAALSRIKQQLDPSHRELARVGFLESWDYIPFVRAGKKTYQVSWKAGAQWREVLEVQKRHLGVDEQQEGDHLLFLGEAEEEGGEGSEGKEGLLVNILDLIGASDKKYLPFWKQAVRDLPTSVIYKQLGDLRERIADGEKIRNKGAYLMKLLRVEGKKRELSWAMKD